MITFPVEDTFPLGDTPKILSEHWGLEEARTYHCKLCGQTFTDRVDYEEHECRWTE